MQTILLISAGAVVGANLRYFLGQGVARAVPSLFPFGTLLINASASFILGLFLIWTTARATADPRLRALIAVGFCGGYSTYSTYAFETYAMLESGRWGTFLLDVLAMNVLCLLAVAAGAAVARSL